MARKFQVCLFDLDQTLIETGDMEEVRLAGKGDNSKEYKLNVAKNYHEKSERHYYSENLILSIRKKFPELKLGIFTRSPRSYTETILQLAYPSIDWDVIIAYEDVERTKPYGEGIDKAMWSFDYTSIKKVILVGDGEVDIRAAYNAGCVVVLDRSSWGHRNTRDNWNSLKWIPDAIIDTPESLINVLSAYEDYLPELERLLASAESRSTQPRFDRINKFIPKDVGGDNSAFPIYSSGRSFSAYPSLEWRRKRHKLSKQIQEQKDATTFPDEWIQVVRTFIKRQFIGWPFAAEHLISVIPARPGRTPRLENFLRQVSESNDETAINKIVKFSFVPDLLAYKKGVKSNSNDKLGALERFANVRDHLFVNKPELAARAARVLVIDDVSTTGSSLIFAKKYLVAAGAKEVTCLSLAMNISNVLYE